MKGLFAIMICKHLGLHAGAITVLKIFGELNFRMALVIVPGKSTDKSNDDYLSSIGATLGRGALVQCGCFACTPERKRERLLRYRAVGLPARTAAADCATAEREAEATSPSNA